MRIAFTSLLRRLLIFGGAYLAADALFHLSNLRILDPVAAQAWPESSVLYAKMMNLFFGSFALLAALLCFELQRDLHKYRTSIALTAVWALLYGLLLVYLASAKNFSTSFAGLPSLHVWTTLYNSLLFLEGLALMLYAVAVYLWTRNGRD
jgi:hypothetical protein